MGDSFTGSAFYDSGEIGFSAMTDNGYPWFGGWHIDNFTTVTFHPFTLTIGFPFAGSNYTGSGEIYLTLDPAFPHWDYWGDSGDGTRFEAISGAITSYHAVPDNGTTLVLFGLALVTLIYIATLHNHRRSRPGMTRFPS